MSKTLTIQQIESHMRQQTNEYLIDWIKFNDGMQAYLEKYGLTDPPKYNLSALARSILQERGVENV